MSHKQPRSSAWTQGQDKHAERVTTQIVSPCPVISLQEERVSFKGTAQLELPANHQEAARSPTVELQGKLDLQPFSHRFYRITGPGSQQRTRPTPPRLYIAQVWKVGGMCPRSFAWFEAGLETKWAKKVQLFKYTQSLLQAQLCVHLWTFPRMSGSTAKSPQAEHEGEVRLCRGHLWACRSLHAAGIFLTLKILPNSPLRVSASAGERLMEEHQHSHRSPHATSSSLTRRVWVSGKNAACSSEAKWPDVQWWSKQRCTRRRLWKESRWLHFVWRDLGSMKQARLYRRPSVRKG